MALDSSTIINSLTLGQNVRWTYYYDVPKRIQYVKPLGTPTLVTYSFSNALQPLPPGLTAANFPGFRPLSEAERATVRQAAAMWDAASGLVLREVGAGQGDIQIGIHSFSPTTSGYANAPGSGLGGDIFFNEANKATLGESDVTLDLALHELGHAFGLKHPFDLGQSGVTLPSGEDKKSNTVMSYTADVPSTNALGPYDVIAIQYLYGPNVPVQALFPAGYSSAGYLASNSDLLNAFGPNEAAADDHYLLSGMREGRTASFDGLRYLASNTDLAAAFGTDEVAAARHYINAGRFEGRNTTSFRPLSYIASYSDLQAALGTDTRAAEMQYLKSGRVEGRTVTFKAYNYLASNFDLIVALGTDPETAAKHYLQSGRAEGRSTTAFNAQTYMQLNPDVAAAFNNDPDRATQHYVEAGWREGRRTIAPLVSRPTAAPVLPTQSETTLQPAAMVAADSFAFQTAGPIEEHADVTSLFASISESWGRDAMDLVITHPDTAAAFGGVPGFAALSGQTRDPMLTSAAWAPT
ncbi:matrixin family metalloprotease (plasmid) [Azospirillum sp. A26]|uniref:matrixin family metalloprotease n=1 Tax=Azospirillum sp. A26 TaxID=3160607 RepID=UPI00366F78DB